VIFHGFFIRTPGVLVPKEFRRQW